LAGIIFAFQTVAGSVMTLGYTTAEYMQLDQRLARFELEKHWYEEPYNLRCELMYRTHVFKPSTIQTLGERLIAFLDALLMIPP
jgi:hypothetical protein